MLDMKNEIVKLQMKLSKEGNHVIADQLAQAKKIEDEKLFKITRLGFGLNMLMT